MSTMTVWLYSEKDGKSHPHTIPAEWVICESCRGSGGSSAYLGAFTGEEMREIGDEWCEDYRVGRFDRTCEDCRGSGKALVPFAPDDADDALLSLIDRWEAQERERAEWATSDAAVRRAESGYSW